MVGVEQGTKLSVCEAQCQDVQHQSLCQVVVNAIYLRLCQVFAQFICECRGLFLVAPEGLLHHHTHKARFGPAIVSNSLHCCGEQERGQCEVKQAIVPLVHATGATNALVYLFQRACLIKVDWHEVKPRLEVPQVPRSLVAFHLKDWKQSLGPPIIYSPDISMGWKARVVAAKDSGARGQMVVKMKLEERWYRLLPRQITCCTYHSHREVVLDIHFDL
mmetsp:Transcript_25224/g.58041  ORF Transcript_25224/g.58041 Transcript_25224/m.58041 type:complete len:218 (+) Transcript_25224:903-1556(+)